MAVDCTERILQGLYARVTESIHFFFSEDFILQRQLLRQLLTWSISIPLLKAANKLRTVIYQHQELKEVLYELYGT